MFMVFFEGEIDELPVCNVPPEEPVILSTSVDEGGGSDSANIVPSVYGGMNYSASRNILGTGTCSIPRSMCRQNSLMEFLQKPSLVFRGGYVSGSATIIGVPVWEGSNLYSISSAYPGCSRIRFLAQYFRQWRGSVTYTFLLIASPMQTFRMKIALDYQGGTLATVDPGDTMQQIITVRGTTVHQVTVPYNYTTPLRPCGNTHYASFDITPQVTMSEFSPASKSGDTVPNFYFLVYESANRDFEFQSQVEPMPNAIDSSLTHQAQCSVNRFRSHDATQFGHVTKVHYASDNVTTFEAMAKRWSPRVNASLSPQPLHYESSYVSTAAISRMSTFDSFGAIFYYSRGQVKFKISFDADPSVINPSAMGIVKMANLHPVAGNATAGVPAAVRFSDGCTCISYGLTQVIEVTVPFVCNVDWTDTNATTFQGVVGAQPYQEVPEIWTEGTDTSVPLNFVAVAAGKDFCYSYSLPPPYFGNRWYDCVPFAALPSTTQSISSQKVRGKTM